MKQGAAAAALMLVAAPAYAQDGAMWVDKLGRNMSMDFAGGNGQPVAPRDRAAPEMAAAFKRLCVDAGAIASAIDPVAVADGLAPVPRTVPAGKAAAIVLPIWRADGLVVSQTDGFFAAPLRQCNATFYVSTLPARQSLIDAVSAALGSQPANIAKATRKNGEPQKWYTPEWTVSGSNGASWIASATLATEDQYSPGNRVQLALRAANEKVR